MAKLTAFEVLSSINEIRKFTAPPAVGEPKQIGIDQVIEVDGKLLALQERLLDDYGADEQGTTLAVARPCDMAHGVETDDLTRRSLASLSGQDWINDRLTDDDESAVEMTVMFLVALAARGDEGFNRAVAAYCHASGRTKAGNEIGL